MGTWIVGAVILFLAGWAAYRILRDGKSGKGCGCDGCGACPSSCGEAASADRR